MKAIVLMLVAGCGAQPNQPLLANAPRPNPAAVAGGAAAAAAAITLAAPDAATPEKNQVTEKKPVKVKENVPSAVLDRLDQAPVQEPASSSAKPAAKPAPVQPGTAAKPPRDALDFSQP